MKVTSVLIMFLATSVGQFKAQTLLASATKEYHWENKYRRTFATRDESTGLCNMWGMKVATFRNEKEQSVLNNFPNFVDPNAITYVWNQLRRRSSGDFLYDDGTAAFFDRFDQHWGPQPSNISGKDCVVALGSMKSPWWYQIECEQRLRTVCEKITVDYHANEWEGTCEAGLKQSPIDLHKGLLMTQPLYWHKSKIVQKPLEFTREAYVVNSFIILNNGHTVKIMFNSAMTSSAIMSGYGLEEGYIFAQAHLHWGTSGFPGSEHALNGSRHSMEIHLVHYKSTYADLHAAIATNDSRALAVYGVFIKGVPLPEYPLPTGCSGCPSHSEWFEAITDNIPLSYNNPVGTAVSTKLDLRSLLPNDGNGIFRYHGSLTTPNCIEGVIWTIKREPILVSQADVEIFQSVRDYKGRPMRSNFRPLRKAALDHKLEYFTLGS